jgi:ubiquinone/menaquinone biosynthesis C-methylase UbiE
MAEGYARFRPPVHERVIELVRSHLPAAGLARALDVGCGAGLSTKALAGLATHAVGIDPAEAMLPWARIVAPAAEFLAAAAEAIPLRAGSVDLITAAGSLNYADVRQFFHEAKRVLVPGGTVVVYDFGPGERADRWFQSFSERYPWPELEAVEVNPAHLAEAGFQIRSNLDFSITLPLARDFYLEYMMTETNVAFAVRHGVPEDDIRTWCSETLRAAWECDRAEVVFKGDFVIAQV